MALTMASTSRGGDISPGSKRTASPGILPACPEVSIGTVFEQAWRSALAAVEPEAAVRQALGNLEPIESVTVVAIGKAAPAMTRGAAAVLGDRLIEGLVVSDHPEPVPSRCRLLIGDHPFPGERSLIAGTQALETAARVRPGATLLALISGGGSALAEVPDDGLTIVSLARLHRRLMEAGTPIQDLNTVRRHLSRLKQGGLGAAARGGLMTLLISDVIDGDTSEIASGPTLADQSTPAQAAEIIAARLGSVAPEFAAALATRPPRRSLEHPSVVVADGRRAAEAAMDWLERAGYQARLITTKLRAEAREAVIGFLDSVPTGVVGIAAGETTVTVKGAGRGGRNQEAALAAALHLDGGEGCFGAFSTDGVDGPTDAAGAIVDGTTAVRIRAAGIDPQQRLAANDSYPALDAARALIRTGPTGTNVGDLWLAGAERTSVNLP